MISRPHIKDWRKNWCLQRRVYSTNTCQAGSRYIRDGNLDRVNWSSLFIFVDLHLLNTNIQMSIYFFSKWWKYLQNTIKRLNGWFNEYILIFRDCKRCTYDIRIGWVGFFFHVFNMDAFLVDDFFNFHCIIYFWIKTLRLLKNLSWNSFIYHFGFLQSTSRTVVRGKNWHALCIYDNGMNHNSLYKHSLMLLST